MIHLPSAQAEMQKELTKNFDEENKEGFAFVSFNSWHESTWKSTDACIKRLESSESFPRA